MPATPRPDVSVPWGQNGLITDPGLIIRSLRFPHRILCNREVQESIKDSVHALIKEQIVLLGLEDRFQSVIRFEKKKNFSAMV